MTHLKEIFSSPKKGNYFFGYYDKSQISKSKNYYASLKVENFYDYLGKDENAEIGYFEKNSQEFKVIDKTKAFNFQQGSMINWIYSDHEEKLIYNVIENGKLFSRISKIHENSKIDLPLPLYSLSNNNKFFLTINFEHLSKYRRGYGYDLNLIDESKSIFKLDEIGIWKLDIDNKNINKIISKEDFQLENKNYWIEHITISPNNYDFVFLLRSKNIDGGIKTDFFLSDIEKSKLIKINNSGRTSHFNWIAKNKLVVYGGLPNKFNKFRKSKFFQSIPGVKIILKFYHLLIRHDTLISKKLTGDCYYIYDTEKLEFNKIENDKLNSEDGHPTVDTIENRYMITDTYSDLPKKKASLILYDLLKNNEIQRIEVDSLEELDNSPFRCDLHPRFLENSLYFSIDCFNENNRSFKVYQILK